MVRSFVQNELGRGVRPNFEVLNYFSEARTVKIFLVETKVLASTRPV